MMCSTFSVSKSTSTTSKRIKLSIKPVFTAYICAALIMFLCNMLSGGLGAEGQWHKQAWYEGDAYGSIENRDGVVHISAAGDEGNDIRLCRTMNVDKNSYYRISCAVKTHSPNMTQAFPCLCP